MAVTFKHVILLVCLASAHIGSEEYGDTVGEREKYTAAVAELRHAPTPSTGIHSFQEKRTVNPEYPGSDFSSKSDSVTPKRHQNTALDQPVETPEKSDGEGELSNHPSSTQSYVGERHPFGQNTAPSAVRNNRAQEQDTTPMFVGDDIDHERINSPHSYVSDNFLSGQDTTQTSSEHDNLHRENYPTLPTGNPNTRKGKDEEMLQEVQTASKELFQDQIISKEASLPASNSKPWTGHHQDVFKENNETHAVSNTGIPKQADGRLNGSHEHAETIAQPLQATLSPAETSHDVTNHGASKDLGKSQDVANSGISKDTDKPQNVTNTRDGWTDGSYEQLEVLAQSVPATPTHEVTPHIIDKSHEATTSGVSIDMNKSQGAVTSGVPIDMNKSHDATTSGVSIDMDKSHDVTSTEDALMVGSYDKQLEVSALPVPATLTPAVMPHIIDKSHEATDSGVSIDMNKSHDATTSEVSKDMDKSHDVTSTEDALLDGSYDEQLDTLAQPVPASLTPDKAKYTPDSHDATNSEVSKYMDTSHDVTNTEDEFMDGSYDERLETLAQSAPATLTPDTAMYTPDSPFLRVEDQFPLFQEQVAALHAEMCGTTCGFKPLATRHVRAKNCALCHCDPLCRVYRDCCPDIQLHLSATSAPGAQLYRRKRQTSSKGEAIFQRAPLLGKKRLASSEGEYLFSSLLNLPSTASESVPLVRGKRQASSSEVGYLSNCEAARIGLQGRFPDGDHLRNYFSMVNSCSHARPSTAHHSTVLDSSAPDVNESSGESGDVSLEARCENRRNRSHWDYVRPVTAVDGLVYRNAFCAQCHGHTAANVTAWGAAVHCDAQLLRSVTSPADAYFLAVSTPNCSASFFDESWTFLHSCTYSDSTLVSSCNQTGLWRVHDEKVERACASFTSVVKRKYKNAFCYMCNTDSMFDVVKYNLNVGSTNQANIARSSFFALLDFDADDADDGGSLSATMTHSEEQSGGDDRQPADCEDGNVRDPLQQCQCRPLQCGSGLRVNGTECAPVFPYSNYFGYTVCHRITIRDRWPIARILADSFGRNLARLMSEGESSLMTFPVLDCEDSKVLTFDVQMKVYSATLSLRDLANVTISDTRKAGTILNDFYPTVTVVSVVSPAPRCLTRATWPGVIPDTCPTKGLSESIGVLTAGTASMFSPQEQKIPSYAVLGNTTFCPHVNLTESEFHIYRLRLRQLGLSERNITIDEVGGEEDVDGVDDVDNVDDVDDVNGVGNVHDVDDVDDAAASGVVARYYLVCWADYSRVASPETCGAALSNASSWVGALGGFEDTWTALGLASTVSTCLSLGGLTCVIVTYAMLPPLRAKSGQSTLAMACLLFLAQLFHEMGLEQFEIHALCLSLGVLIHFLWLAAVFMMTSCTLQLFLSIVTPFLARALIASRKTLTVSLLSSCSLAAAVVGVTVVTSRVVDGDAGYPARRLCFIRRPLPRLLAFALPLGLAVVINVVLFLVAVVTLQTRPGLSSTRRDRVSLAACFRLSVITGACWLSLFLLAVPGTRPWLEYAVVALMGLQGLLLASTLVFNARVAALWREVLSKRSQSPPGSSSTRQTDVKPRRWDRVLGLWRSIVSLRRESSSGSSSTRQTDVGL